MKKIEHDLISEDNTFIEYDENSINYNSPHDYIIKNVYNGNELCKIHFQEGPVKEVNLNGVFIEDLIAICINRLESFQIGDFRTRENAVVITKLEESLMWLGKRTANRKKRNVQGTYKV